jgi:transcription elongation factor Elf1
MVKSAVFVRRVYLSHLNQYVVQDCVDRSGMKKMCPRNAAFKVPHNQIKILVKEAKQMVNGPYYCPKCRKELLQILADTKKKEVFAICTCGLEQQLTYAPVFQCVDYYSKFMDMYKKKKL